MAHGQAPTGLAAMFAAMADAVDEHQAQTTRDLAAARAETERRFEARFAELAQA